MEPEQEMKATDASDDEEIEVNPQGNVELVLASRLPTLSALWKLPAISAPLTGTGSGLFKKFAKDLMDLVFKFVIEPRGVENPLPKQMLVYHGPMPSVTQVYTNKQ
jgi:hypothetical protein